MFKFMHAADIHLDSPLLNLDQYDGAPVDVFRNATRTAFDNMIDLAIDEQVQFVLIAGDLYDGDCRDSSTPLHFRRQMVRLKERDIGVFIIQGNHDAGVRKAYSFELPDNVTLFSTRKPETHTLPELQVAIHGQGFAEREIHEDLSLNYPTPEPGWFNLGMLHTSCGHYEQHTSYAPSTIRGLTDKGYQYWALGHIHKREVLAQGRCWIVYSGNTQGRHIRETGVKGCEIVTVDHGEVTRVENRPVDVVRWQQVVVDASVCPTTDDVMETICVEIVTKVAEADGRPLAVRIHIQGETTAHTELVRHGDHWSRTIRETIVDRFDDLVWVEKIKFQTRSPNKTSQESCDAIRQLLSGIDELEETRLAIDELRPEIDQLLRFVPTDPRIENEHFEFSNTLEQKELTHDIKEMLISRLLESEMQG